MSEETKLVKIRATTKQRLDDYIESLHIKVYLGDLVDYAVNEYLNKVVKK